MNERAWSARVSISTWARFHSCRYFLDPPPGEPRLAIVLAFSDLIGSRPTPQQKKWRGETEEDLVNSAFSEGLYHQTENYCIIISDTIFDVKNYSAFSKINTK